MDKLASRLIREIFIYNQDKIGLVIVFFSEFFKCGLGGSANGQDA